MDILAYFLIASVLCNLVLLIILEVKRDHISYLTGVIKKLVDRKNCVDGAVLSAFYFATSYRKALSCLEENKIAHTLDNNKEILSARAILQRKAKQTEAKKAYDQITD